jgi:hypothetical protein
MAHKQESRLPWTVGQKIASGMLLPVVIAVSAYEALHTHMPNNATPATVKAYERIFDGSIKPVFPQEAGRLIVRSSQLINVQGY